MPLPADPPPPSQYADTRKLRVIAASAGLWGNGLILVAIATTPQNPRASAFLAVCGAMAVLWALVAGAVAILNR